MKLNSKSPAGTKAQQSNEADVTTSAPMMPNPLLAAGLISFVNFLTKRNVLFCNLIVFIIQSFYKEPDYKFFIFLFIVGIYCEICDLVDFSKQKLNITIDNNVNNNIINETGIPLNIQDLKD